MKIMIELPDDIYGDISKYGTVLDEDRDDVAEAIIHGTVLPDDCEILTKEAYSDLCLRASSILDYALESIKEDIRQIGEVNEHRTF